MIYKVNENHLVLMEDGSKNTKNKTFSSLAIHSKAILNQINDTRQKLEHAHYQSKFKISGYIPYMIFSTINVGNITSAVKRSIGSTTGCTITEKAPTRGFSWLKAPTSAFRFKTLLRHYAKQA